MINTDVTEQRSLAWFRQRLGYITGSKVGDLMKSGRRKEEAFGETAKSYLYQVAAERCINKAIVADDEYFQEYVEQTAVTTKAMAWGTEQEDTARELYAQRNGVDVEAVGSCAHDSIPLFAASPDGIVRMPDGTVRIVEIKCPNANTYMRYLTEIGDGEDLKATKPEYYWQVMAEMSCTGATSADFIAYCPWLVCPLHVVTIERNEEDINTLEERVRLANEYIEKNIIPTSK